MKPPPLVAVPDRTRRKSRRKVGLIVAGAALVVAGVLLGIIPVVPGTPLVLLGVGMVATHSSRGRWLRWRVGAWLRQRGFRLPRSMGGGSLSKTARTPANELPRKLPACAVTTSARHDAA